MTDPTNPVTARDEGRLSSPVGAGNNRNVPPLKVEVYVVENRSVAKAEVKVAGAKGRV